MTRKEPEEFIIALDVSRYRSREPGAERSASLALAVPDRSLSPVEVRVLEQGVEKALQIRVEAEIALAGADFINDIDRHTFEVFAHTLDHFREVLDSARHPEDQANLEAMRRVLTQIAADHVVGANALGAAQIRHIMERPIVTPDTRGLVARLLAALAR